MHDRDIFELASQFKTAIVLAHNRNSFSRDISFSHFPRGCCGDTCYLLAAYLRSKGIFTLYVWGDCKGQSHAWLVLKDCRVKTPTPQFYETPTEIREIVRRYGGSISENPVEIIRYEESDLDNGLIIDITGDQFGEDSVYVGRLDTFHRRFMFESAHEIEGLTDYRLQNLYRIISNFLPC